MCRMYDVAIKRSCWGYVLLTVTVHGFFKGLSFPLLATGSLNSIFFGVYGTVIRFTDGENSLHQPSYRSVYIAGCIGGLFQLVVACPVDLVKIKLQMNVEDLGKKSVHSDHTSRIFKSNSPLLCLKELYVQRGIKGWYKGLPVMIVRDVPSFGLYMLTYEGFIRNLAGSESEASTSVLVFSGAMAGAIAWAAIMPIDVIKSRIQSDDIHKPKYKGMIDCAIKSYHAEGPGVFTRGFAMVILRALPTNGAIFFGYATTRKLFRNLSEET